MKREDVYKVIDKERDYQDAKWGGLDHDTEHSVGDWIIYMEYYLNKAKVSYSTSFYTDKPTLNELRKVIALGIAGFEIFGVPERE